MWPLSISPLISHLSTFLVPHSPSVVLCTLFSHLSSLNSQRSPLKLIPHRKLQIVAI